MLYVVTEVEWDSREDVGTFDDRDLAIAAANAHARDGSGEVTVEALAAGEPRELVHRVRATEPTRVYVGYTSEDPGPHKSVCKCGEETEMGVSHSEERSFRKKHRHIENLSLESV